MTATNHAVTGAIIAAVIPHPLIGLPLALLSHFVLDSIPHFGAHTKAKPDSKEFAAILATDGFLLISFLIIVTLAGYEAGYQWWLLPVGALLGVLPDIMWIKHYRNDLRGEEKHWDYIRHFHKKIQRWEIPSGWVIETVWFLAVVIVLNRIIF